MTKKTIKGIKIFTLIAFTLYFGYQWLTYSQTLSESKGSEYSQNAAEWTTKRRIWGILSVITFFITVYQISAVPKSDNKSTKP